MKTLVAVPMKDASQAKTRLAGYLSPRQRERLAMELFQRSQVFFALHFPSFERLVVTPSPAVAQLAAASGAHVLREPCAEGLNQAAAAAFQWAQAREFQRLLLVPADIPVWLVHEVKQLFEHGASHEVVIARAHDGGTNALLLHLPRVTQFEFRYGMESAARHMEWCRSQSLHHTTCNLPFLSRDIDTVDDCLLLRHSLHH